MKFLMFCCFFLFLGGQNLSADEVKELQLALNQRAISFKDELKDAKTKMSAGDCQRMIDRHRSEMEEMQSQLDEERDRMRQQLMTKLNQRKKITKVRTKTALLCVSYYYSFGETLLL